MPSVIAFVFGVLLFFAGTAGLTLEAHGSSVAMSRLPVLILALLHTGAGFLAMGGSAAYAQRERGTVIVCAAVSSGVSAIAALAAIRLAVRSGIALPDRVAIIVVVTTLGAGAIAFVLMVTRARRLSAKARPRLAN